MVRVAIVEDDIIHVRQLEEFLEQYQHEYGEIFQVSVYLDGG